MEALHALVGSTEGVTLLAVENCPDSNWNAAWEASNLPSGLPLDMCIVPDCAFGSGTHPTTRMLMDQMLSLGGGFMSGRRVLDNGCGSGILGILAARLGASSVRAVDMDEKSVASTRANAERNAVRVEALLGSVPPEDNYDLIFSNIHRNVLLAQMPLYARCLGPGGELWLSGFYEADCPPLEEAARNAGLVQLSAQSQDGWWMLRFLQQ
jgi:ribosomal protein L11 methyltransferase